MTTIIEERQKNRWLMLQKIYEITGGRSERCSINMYVVGEKLGWDREKTEATYDYLRGEGLLKMMNFGGNMVLTHQGVREVEEAAANPEKPTLHFPANVMNIYGDHIGGDKVMGDKIGTQINNHTEIAQTSQDIKDLLNRLSDEYPDDSSRVLAAKAIDNVDRNPDLKSRIIKGLKAGSLAALEKAIDHPVATFFVEGAKGLVGN
ncbi:hypothetical protein [Chamaesiphon sp. VAR_48_metabat_403]|uniref:hypothetical protein n=1 Tax=Chamaesiphon sp. VAR_48_metabat_403 TaxID=2964700 RepID=UPI00286EA840|nr:hypothetical protein [Chamaesiphon sp. VAR_48_metabat_403]